MCWLLVFSPGRAPGGSCADVHALQLNYEYYAVQQMPVMATELSPSVPEKLII
jgi:hypothetical protein